MRLPRIREDGRGRSARRAAERGQDCAGRDQDRSGQRLSEAGLKAVEAGAFVSPKWVPQMADSAEVLAGITRHAGVSYPVLVPNMKGFEAAVAAKVEEIAIFGAASETFSQKNINCSIAESLERFAPWRRRRAGTRGCACAAISPACWAARMRARSSRRRWRMSRRSCWRLGCYEISLGDTIGVGTPAKAQAMIEAVASQVPRDRLAVHFHDTYGQALANILATLEQGIAVVDSSVAGLGGCPYAKGATGNVASEDVLYMLNGLGIETGVDLDKLAAAGRFISGALGRASVPAWPRPLPPDRSVPSGPDKPQDGGAIQRRRGFFSRRSVLEILRRDEAAGAAQARSRVRAAARRSAAIRIAAERQGGPQGRAQGDGARRDGCARDRWAGPQPPAHRHGRAGAGRRRRVWAGGAWTADRWMRPACDPMLDPTCQQARSSGSSGGGGSGSSTRSGSSSSSRSSSSGGSWFSWGNDSSGGSSVAAIPGSTARDTTVRRGGFGSIGRFFSSGG